MASTPARTLAPADFQPDRNRLTRLEDELTTLTGHINAATARFLFVLAEFDRLEGWKPHGLVSTAHWLHWRCGFGLNAAREKVRVARALTDLPRIRACFETGALSYSKVRAMTRIATPANEQVLLRVARHGTTRHVETLVSKWRGAERSREVQRAGRQHAVRSLSWRYDEDGCLVIRATLPPEQGALVIEALQAAMDRLEEDSLEENGREENRLEENRLEEGGLQGAGLEAGSLEAGSLEAGSLEAGSLEAGSLEAGSLEAGSLEAGSLEAGSLEAGSLEAGSPEKAGGETYDVEDVEPGQNGTASAVNVRRNDVSAETPYGPSAMSDERSALRDTLGQRRADALVYLSERWLAGDVPGQGSGDAYLVNVHIDSATLAHSVAGRCELAEGPGLAGATVRRLCCDGGLVTHLTDAAGGTVDVGRKTRAIPPAIRRALRHRDRGCRFPGCTRSRWLDGHHLVHWADGGETSLDNLVLLCRHHHRLLHEGGFGSQVDAAGRLRFTTPAGAVIPDAPTGRALERPLARTLATFQLKRGLAIDARTADCRWRGEPMDYDHAGWLLMQAATRDESGQARSSR